MRGNHTKASIVVLLVTLVALAAPFSASAATDISILSVMGSPWRFTNCVGLGGSPASQVPLISSPTYDASTWAQGTGLFGIETTPAEYLPYTFTTPIPNPGATPPGPLVEYFRTTFNWSSGDPAAVTLRSTNYIDDGAIWYLNGVEVGRRRVTITDDLPDCTTVFGQNPAAEGDPVANGDIFNFPLGVLKTGLNVLVVVLVQSGTGSSDDVFGMSLTATLPEIPTNCSPNQPTNRTVRLNQVVTLVSCGTGSPAPTFQWQQDGVDIAGATSATYIFTNTADLALNGSHTFRAHISNVVGAFDTRTATILFTDDTDPPQILRVLGGADGTNIVVEFDEFVNVIEAADPLNFILTDASQNEIGRIDGALAPNGTSSIIAVSPATPLQDGQTYTLTIFGDTVHDLAGNAMPETVRTFVAPTHNECSVGSMETYNGTPGPLINGLLPTSGGIVTLTSHPTFPNSPSESFRLTTGFNSRDGYPDDSHEEYGGRLRGLFIPPVSGSWHLFIRSDDPGALYFNPNGPSSSGRTLVAQETGCCNAFLEPGALQTSTAFNLTAGQSYYIEALWREYGGGDYAQVAARLDGDPTLAADLTPIPPAWLGSATLPGVAGSFTITQPPANASVVAGQSATFTVGTSADDIPLCYQWLQNGVEIPGAVGHRLVLPSLPEGPDSTISVRVSMVGGGSKTSANATLHVGVDLVPPVAVSASADINGRVLVSFRADLDVDLDPITSQVASNYKIDGVAPLSATQTNTTNVLLVAAAPFATCVDHTVVITGVKDLSQNNLTPNPTTLHFTAPILLVDKNTSQTWRYNDLNVDLGTAWRAPGYDDSAWPTGQGVLGWEPGPGPAAAGWEMPVTNLFANFGAVATVNVFTTYLRTKFTLPTHPASVKSLSIDEVCDDAAAVYLNGQLLQLNRLTEPFTFTTLGGGSPEPADGTHTVESFTGLPTSALVAGENVLAVELHQSAITSSDAVWGCQLVAVVDRCGVGLTITATSATQARLTWTDASYGVEGAPAIGGPWTTQPGASGLTVNINAGNRFFRLKK